MPEEWKTRLIDYRLTVRWLIMLYEESKSYERILAPSTFTYNINIQIVAISSARNSTLFFEL